MVGDNSDEFARNEIIDHDVRRNMPSQGRHPDTEGPIGSPVRSGTAETSQEADES
jgi:hypothetical protein